MKIPQIQIQTTKAQIGLTIQDPEQTIRQRPAEMSIEQPAAEVSIQTKQGIVEMDGTQLRADLGMYTFTQFARNAAQQGVQMVLEGIGRRAQEGRQLGDIVNGNTIGSIERARAKNNIDSSIGIKFIPSYQAIALNYIPADVQVDIKPQKPIIQVKVNKPEHNYTPGKVDIELLQKPSIQIDWKI